ncbi:glycosyltransferase [Candidatus Sumerlaeota bacterium]|nr:glycosyltransferase [Candidatus Sumerlaeota bacterium]
MTPPENLRVLHLDTGRSWRGGQNQVLSLCRGLHDAGIAQWLVAQPGSALSRRAAEAGIDVVERAMRGEMDFFSSRWLKGLVSRSGVHLVHAHDAHAHALAWGATRNLPSVVPVVSRRVDFPVSNHFLSRRKYLDPRVRYLAISNGVRDVLIRGGVSRDAITVVPSGVDPNRFSYDVPRSRLRREFEIPDDGRIVGTVGSLADHKGHRYLIEAAALVASEHPDVRFFIVGDGELRRDLEERIRRSGLEKTVRLTGFREDVETFLAGFDVFALSSHLEGLCTSVIDAMLFALPVVATRTGGVPDLVRDGETGLLVEPRDPAALAQGILTVLDDRNLAARLGEAGRSRARNRFTAEAMVAQTLESYARFLP